MICRDRTESCGATLLGEKSPTHTYYYMLTTVTKGLSVLHTPKYFTSRFSSPSKVHSTVFSCCDRTVRNSLKGRENSLLTPPHRFSVILAQLHNFVNSFLKKTKKILKKLKPTHNFLIVTDG